MYFTVSVTDGLYEVVDISLCCTVSGIECYIVYFTVSVTDRLYEVVDWVLYCIRVTLLIRVLYCFSDGRTVRGG